MEKHADPQKAVGAGERRCVPQIFWVSFGPSLLSGHIFSCVSWTLNCQVASDLCWPTRWFQLAGLVHNFPIKPIFKNSKTLLVNAMANVLGWPQSSIYLGITFVPKYQGNTILLSSTGTRRACWCYPEDLGKAEAGATESRTKCRTKLRGGRAVRSAAVSRQKAGSWAQTTEQVLQKAGNKTERAWDTNCKFRLQRFRPLAGASGSHPNQSKKVERAKCWLKVC